MGGSVSAKNQIRGNVLEWYVTIFSEQILILHIQGKGTGGEAEIKQGMGGRAV